MPRRWPGTQLWSRSRAAPRSARAVSGERCRQVSSHRRSDQRPGQVDRQHARPALERQRVTRCYGTDPCVVDKHVDPTELPARRVREILHLLGISHISDPGMNTQLASPEPVDQRAWWISRVCRRDHRHASLCKLFDDRRAYSTARPGHDGYLFCAIHS